MLSFGIVMAHNVEMRVSRKFINISSLHFLSLHQRAIFQVTLLSEEAHQNAKFLKRDLTVFVH